MLIIEKMEKVSFSSAEKSIINFIKENPNKINNLTMRKIAQITHTNTTSTVRVAKKLGFAGWVSFKEEYLSEYKYINNIKNHEIDTNYPFNQYDNVIEIANNISKLEQFSIQDTFELLDYKELSIAQKLFKKTNTIKIFTSQANHVACHEFVRSLRKIGRDVKLIPEGEYLAYEAYATTETDCAILLSFTGHNNNIRIAQEIVKQNRTPTLSITSVGENPIAENSDCALYLSTSEKLYSKVGEFSSTVSLVYLLDVLYSLVFQVNYSENLEYLKRTGKLFNDSIASSNMMGEV